MLNHILGVFKTEAFSTCCCRAFSPPEITSEPLNQCIWHFNTGMLTCGLNEKQMMADKCSFAHSWENVKIQDKILLSS